MSYLRRKVGLNFDKNTTPSPQTVVSKHKRAVSASIPSMATTEKDSTLNYNRSPVRNVTEDRQEQLLQQICSGKRRILENDDDDDDDAQAAGMDKKQSFTMKAILSDRPASNPHHPPLSPVLLTEAHNRLTAVGDHSDVKAITPRDPPYVANTTALRGSYAVVSGFDKLQDALVKLMDRIPDGTLEDKWVRISKYLDHFSVEHTPERVTLQLQAMLSAVQTECHDSALPSPNVPLVSCACVAIDQVSLVLRQLRPCLADVLDTSIRIVHKALYVDNLPDRPSGILDEPRDDLLRNLLRCFTHTLYFQQCRDLGRKLVGVQRFVEETIVRRRQVCLVMNRAVQMFAGHTLKSTLNAWRSVVVRERTNREKEKEMTALRRELEQTRRLMNQLEVKLQNAEDAAKEQVLKTKAMVADRDMKLQEQKELYDEVKRNLFMSDSARQALETKLIEAQRASNVMKQSLEDKYASVVHKLRAALEDHVADPPGTAVLVAKWDKKDANYVGVQRVAEWLYAALALCPLYGKGPSSGQELTPETGLFQGSETMLERYCAVFHVVRPTVFDERRYQEVTQATCTPLLRDRAVLVHQFLTEELRLPHSVITVDSLYVPGDEAGNIVCLSTLMHSIQTPLLRIAQGLEPFVLPVPERRIAASSSQTVAMSTMLANAVTPDTVVGEMVGAFQNAMRRLAEQHNIIFQAVGGVLSRLRTPRSMTAAEESEKNLYVTLDEAKLKQEWPAVDLKAVDQSLRSVQRHYITIRNTFTHYESGFTVGPTPKPVGAAGFGQDEAWSWLRDSGMFLKGVVDRTTIRVIFKGLRNSTSMEPDEFVTMLLRLAALRGDPTLTLPQQVTQVLETFVTQADYIDVGAFLRDVAASRHLSSVLDLHKVDTEKVYGNFASSEEFEMTHDDFERATKESGVSEALPMVTSQLLKHITRSIQPGELLSIADFHVSLIVLACYFMPLPWVPLHVKLRVFLNTQYLVGFKKKLGLLTIQT